MEMVNTIVGVTMSLAGSVAVAPSALGRLGEMAKRDATRVRGFLARFIPALRRTHNVHVGGTIAALSTVTAAVGTSWSVAAPVELTTGQKVDALWERTNRLHDELRGLVERHQQASKELREGIQAAVDEARDKHQVVTQRIDQMESEQVELNAAAFPLIGFGIFISGLDGELAMLPIWANVSILGLAAAVSVRVVAPNIVRWQTERSQRKALELQGRKAPQGATASRPADPS